MASGTIVKLIPDQDTKDAFGRVFNLLNVENAVSIHDLHLTVVYSQEECSGTELLKVKLPIYASGIGFEIFTQADNTNCLVLRVGSADIQYLHHRCIVHHGALHSYPEYKPHITLSYDYPCSIIPNDGWLEEFNNIVFESFVVEPIDPNWVTTNPED